MFEVEKPVQVLDWIYLSMQFTTMSRFNASGRAPNSQTIHACNVKVFMMVEFDMFQSPAV